MNIASVRAHAVAITAYANQETLDCRSSRENANESAAAGSFRMRLAREACRALMTMAAYERSAPASACAACCASSCSLSNRPFSGEHAQLLSFPASMAVQYEPAPEHIVPRNRDEKEVDHRGRINALKHVAPPPGKKNSERRERFKHVQISSATKRLDF